MKEELFHIPPGKTAYININKHIIMSNRKSGKREPPIRVTLGRHGKPQYFRRLSFDGVIIVYDPDHPLPCGAQVWIEVANDN